MATVQTKLLTAEEFYQWANHPDNRHRHCDLVRGEIIEMPRPGKLHGMVCANVVWILSNYCRQRRTGYVCSNDTGVIIERGPDTVRGPDVMLFDDATTYEEVKPTFGDKPPLLAVEVLSPNDTAGKLMERITDQLRFGTPLVWVLDPDARNACIYRPGKEPYLVRESGDLTGEEILPDFRCRVAELFALPGR